PHRGRAVPPPYAADRRRRHDRDLAVQDRVFAVRRRAGRGRLARSSRARMGAADQPAGPAARLRPAVQALRGQPHPAMAAETTAQRLEGGLGLLFMIFVLSSFLDNIAAALIGGTIAGAVFRGKLHIGYLAAIVAASNAGGSG